MGNVFSQCLSILVRRQDHDTVPIPKAVKEVFEKYATDGQVITSKQLLKFFQDTQKDKSVLRGPIANLLLSFPSSSGPTPGEEDGASAGGMGSMSEGSGSGGTGGGRAFRSMSMGKDMARGAQMMSRAMNKISLTVGSRNVQSSEPNIEHFFKLLLNPLATTPYETKVTQDMKRPFSEYYIFTGHNSYLKGNQLTSDSSVKPIIKSLTRGVRVIELDLWPNRENTDILVMHGGTLTKPVGFEDCIAAIKEHAFKKSEFPVIITLEDHLPAILQAKAAQSLTAILGDSLYYPKEGEHEMTQFPSPYALRKKIIISTQPPKPPAELKTVLATDEAAQKLFDGIDEVGMKGDGGSDNGDTGGDAVSTGGAQGSDDNSRSKGGQTGSSNNAASEVGKSSARSVGTLDANGELLEVGAGEEELKDIVNLSAKGGETEVGQEGAAEVIEEALQEKAPEYRRLITIPGGRLKGATLSEGLQDQEFVKRISLSETQLASAAKSVPQELVRFTQRNLLRIYPFGLRVLSSNYNPMPAWLHGAQMVALNMQGYGRPLWLVHGFFKANGGCGYVPKPSFYLHRKGGITWPPPIPEAAEVEGAEGLAAASSVSAMEIFNPHDVRPVQLYLRMKVLVATGFREYFGDTHFDLTSPPDFYIKVSIEGVPADVVEKRLDVCNNHWHPSWEDITLEFALILPELALLCIEVMERDRLQDDFAGQVVLPVGSLKPGFRCVTLCDKKGKPMVEADGASVKGPRLLCLFELEHAAGEAEAASAPEWPPAQVSSSLDGLDLDVSGKTNRHVGRPQRQSTVKFQ